MTTSLWGELPEITEIKTPIVVLTAQARALQDITKESLTCELTATPNADGIMHVMRIVAPSLGNYSVVLVIVTHQAAAYPCKIASPFIGVAPKKCDDEARLEVVLKGFLQHAKTRELIGNLLQQIRAANSIAA
jgi:hypothetical protein